MFSVLITCLGGFLDSDMSAEVLTKALAELSQLSPTARRAVGAVVGAVVADAATRPFHWVYDQEVIEHAMQSSSRESLEFWPVSMSPFYTIPTGRRSCYSDECECMLRSLPSSLTVSYSHHAFTHELRRRFSSRSDYAEALANRKVRYDGSQRESHKDPSDGPWQNQSVTTFLRTGEGDRNINESDGFCGTIPLIAWLAAGGSSNDSSFENIVEEACKTLSGSNLSIQHPICIGQLLHHIITNDCCQDSVYKEVLHNHQKRYEDSRLGAEIAEVLEELDDEVSFVDSIANFGKACAFPGSFQGSILTSLKYSSYVDGIRMNIRAGGCNCSRANIAGALMGARWGIGLDASFGRGVPEDWIMQTDGGVDMLVMAVDKLKCCKIVS